ncbi:MAG TPA: serine/threonine-protein kinase PknK, partial [Polyangiaceae bacterium]
FPVAIARAGKALACGAEGETVGRLRALQADAHRWLGHLDEAETAFGQALAGLPPGNQAFYDAASELVSVRVRLGRTDGLGDLVAVLAGTPPTSPGMESARVIAWARAAVSLVFAGSDGLAARLFERMDAVEGEAGRPSAKGRVHQARATRALVRGDLSTYLEHTMASAACFEESGDSRTACVQRGNAGYALGMLGAYAEAEAALRGSLVTAQRMGLESAAASARQNLGLVLAHRGALQEARAVEESSVESMKASGETILAACSQAYLAEILTLARNYGAAERAALDALTTVGDRAHEVRALASAALARVLLATQRLPEALEASAVAETRLSANATFGGEATVRLVRAEALHASGRADAATDAIRVARDRLLANAGKIASEEMRRSFLERVPTNARTLALAREWLDE